MKNSDMDARIKAAFDALELPDSVREKTLATIEGEAKKKINRDCCGADESKAAQALPLTEHVDQNVADSIKQVSPASPASVISSKRPRYGRVVLAMAACLIFVVALFGVSRIGSNPTAFVDIDINPSIELQLNRFDKVIGVEGVNEDGRSVVSNLSLIGLSYAEALEKLTTSDALAPYLSADSFIQVTVSSDNQDQEQFLTSQSEAQLSNLPYRGSCHTASVQMHGEAHAHGMGCGRYAAALELTELDPSINIDDCEKLSMRELRDRIEHCHRTSTDTQSTSDTESNGEESCAENSCMGSESESASTDDARNSDNIHGQRHRHGYGSHHNQ